MKKVISIEMVTGIVFLSVLLLTNVSSASQISYIESKSLWQYDVINLNPDGTDPLWGDDPDGPGPIVGDLWSTVGYSSFNWTVFDKSEVEGGWTTGNAVFGNVTGAGYPGSYSTYWAQNTDLALQQFFTIASLPTGPLTLNIGSDNGFVIFLNGVQLAKENAEGYTSNPYAQVNPQWEYSFVVDPALFVLGDNVVQVLAEDHWSQDDKTFFDMELYSTAVPEPATMSLFLCGLLGLTWLRRSTPENV